MPLISLQCKNCNRLYSSGINLGVGATVTLKGNLSQCPYCDSMESIPDGTFKGTVEGIVRILDQSDNPLGTARDLLEALERSKNSEDLDKLKESSKYFKFKKWLPDSPKKIAAYIAIIYTIIKLLSNEPMVHVEYNQQFINIYNQKIILDQNKSR